MEGNIIQGLNNSVVKCVHRQDDIFRGLQFFICRWQAPLKQGLHASYMVCAHLSTYIGQ